MLCQHLGFTHIDSVHHGGLCPHQPLGLHIVPTSYSLRGKKNSDNDIIDNIY